jgi:ATP/maltotriose-dependent transcriptional regulator MalT
MLGRLAEAESEVSGARRLLSDLDLSLYLANDAIFYSGYVDVLAGDPETAAERIRHWCEVLERTGELTVRVSGLAVLAQIAAEGGDIDEAMRLSASSLANSSPDDLHVQVVSRCARASALARAGDLHGARAAAEQAVELLSHSDWLDLRGDSQAVLAEVHLAAGHRRDACSAMDQARDLYAAKENLVKLGRAEAQLGRWRS